MNLLEYIHRQKRWSKTTFGTGKRTVGLCKHITKELAEIQAEPNSVTEWCDVIILALDGAWRAGHKPHDICCALLEKQKRNFKREWPENVPEDEPVEHVRT